MGRSREQYLRLFQVSVALACGLEFLGLCIQIIALISPAWYSIGYDTSNHPWRLQEGIWLSKFCRENEECLIGERGVIFDRIGVEGSLSSLRERYWVEFRVVSSFSTLAGLFTVICSIITLVKFSTCRNYCRQMSIVCVTAVGALATFLSMAIPTLKILSISRGVSDLGTSWGLLLGLICLVFHILTTFVLAVAGCLCASRMRRSGQRRRHREQRQLREERLSRMQASLQPNVIKHCKDAAADYLSDQQEPPVDYTVCGSVRSLSSVRHVLPLQTPTPSAIPDNTETGMTAKLPAYDELSISHNAAYHI